MKYKRKVSTSTNCDAPRIDLIKFLKSTEECVKCTVLLCSGVARGGRSAPGGTFWGAAKLTLYLKTKIERM